MIEIKINDKIYKVKTEWSEFLYKDFVKVIQCDGKSLAERISICSEIPLDLVNKLTFKQVSFLCEAFTFLDEPDNVLLFAKPFKDELNIGRRTYKELEESLIYIRKASNHVLSFDKVIKIYYDEDISEQPILDCFGKCSFVLDLINKFLTEFKRLGEYEPSLEEIEAGVDELSKFGFFSTAIQLARKYGQTHDEVLNMPAREVYTTLLYDFEQSEVEKRLNQIRSRKK